MVSFAVRHNAVTGTFNLNKIKCDFCGDVILDKYVKRQIFNEIVEYQVLYRNKDDKTKYSKKNQRFIFDEYISKMYKL